MAFGMLSTLQHVSHFSCLFFLFRFCSSGCLPRSPPLKVMSDSIKSILEEHISSIKEREKWKKNKSKTRHKLKTEVEKKVQSRELWVVKLYLWSLEPHTHLRFLNMFAALLTCAQLLQQCISLPARTRGSFSIFIRFFTHFSPSCRRWALVWKTYDVVSFIFFRYLSLRVGCTSEELRMAEQSRAEWATK